MPVVHVMGVRMRMGQRLMPVPVRVRHLLQLSWPVLMLVVLVVRVLMRVFQGLMGMPVLVNVGAEQDCAPGHPRQCQERGRVHGLVQEYPREQRGEDEAPRNERHPVDAVGVDRLGEERA